MRKRWILVSIAATALTVGVVGTALVARAAQTTAVAVTGQSPGLVETLISGRMKQLLALRQKLNLSADQRTEIRQIVAEHKAELLAVIRPLVHERRALRDAIASSNNGSDEKSIRAVADEMGKRIGDAAVVAAKVRGEIAMILTPEQRASIAAFRKQTQHTVDDALDRAATDKPLVESPSTLPS